MFYFTVTFTLLLSNFICCKSFLESSSPDIFAPYEITMYGSIDSGNFSVRGYLPLIQKDSTTHMHILALSEGRTFFQAGFMSRKLWKLSLMFSTGLASQSVSYFFFPLLITFFVFMHGFWFCFILHRWGSLIMWLTWETLASIIKTS